MGREEDERKLDPERLRQTILYCLDRGMCFTVSCRDECDEVRQVALAAGYQPFLVHELEKDEEAFFIGPFGTIIFGRVVDKRENIAVWRGHDKNKTSRHCTITSAIYRRIPKDAYDSYKIWARRWCPWPRIDY